MAIILHPSMSLSPSIADLQPLLLAKKEVIRLLGGAAGLVDRSIAAGWLQPAIRGRVNYYRYSDILALSERLQRELPARPKAQEDWLARNRKGAKKEQTL